MFTIVCFSLNGIIFIKSSLVKTAKLLNIIVITQRIMEQDEKFLEYLVKALVDNPDAVKVNRKVDEMGVLISLDVALEDMGKIIGRSGNTAKAIRTLLRVVGMKNNARVNLKINEPEGGRPRPPASELGGEQLRPPVAADAEASVDEVMNDLKSI
jgi:hypothetical protein